MMQSGIPFLQLLLTETCAFRQQYPGKFCLLSCSVCTFFAVLGQYVPGIILSYVLILGIFLWPLLSSVDVEPFLQKMDLGLWDIHHNIKETKASGCSQLQSSQTEARSAESDPSFTLPQVDLILCKEMCVSDTEASGSSWTEDAFTLSERHTSFSDEHTPVTDQSEDLDREGVPDHLQGFLSLDDGIKTNSSSDEDNLLLTAPIPHLSVAEANSLSKLEGQYSVRTGQLDDSDSDVEDFELLDQSELEHCDTELDLIQKKTEERTEHHSRHSVFKFFSRLLQRQ